MCVPPNGGGGSRATSAKRARVSDKATDSTVGDVTAVVSCACARGGACRNGGADPGA